jgi:EAL domain-containing protein (putative c-di-GMP-specific phosphodiesterase class I)
VRSSIELAHIMKVTALAEGVEDEEAFNILRDLGCDYIQGYYLSKPLKDREFIEWCKAFNNNFGL